MTAAAVQSVVTNEAAVRAMHDAFDRRDAEAGAQTFAPTFSTHGVELPREALAAVWNAIWTRFSPTHGSAHGSAFRTSWRRAGGWSSATPTAAPTSAPGT